MKNILIILLLLTSTTIFSQDINKTNDYYVQMNNSLQDDISLSFSYDRELKEYEMYLNLENNNLTNGEYRVYTYLNGRCKKVGVLFIDDDIITYRLFNNFKSIYNNIIIYDYEYEFILVKNN